MTGVLSLKALKPATAPHRACEEVRLCKLFNTACRVVIVLTSACRDPDCKNTYNRTVGESASYSAYKYGLSGPCRAAVRKACLLATFGDDTGDWPEGILMTATYDDRSGLSVDTRLVAFLEEELLEPLGIGWEFWDGFAALFTEYAPKNEQFLAERARLQTAIDTWFEGGGGPVPDQQAMLEEIGYLVPEPASFAIDTPPADEALLTPGPQLVVPASNARYALNAANARWGSLYDALYGTDVIEPPTGKSGYDAARGAKVVAYAKRFLDEAAPLADGSHADVAAYSVESGALCPALRDPSAFVGYRGPAAAPCAVLLMRNGLRIEVAIDRSHRIGATDKAGVADVIMESALTTIIDFEDSVAAVDCADKLTVYRNWAGLIRGDLTTTFQKGTEQAERALSVDRDYLCPNGSAFSLAGRSLLFARNVGLHMKTAAVRLPDGALAPEGILDAVVTALVGRFDRDGRPRFGNSASGSVYVVKPKMHGPAECTFAMDVLAQAEALAELPNGTIKIGLMDEERRTSANLAACIHALRKRIVFINTGFLDRTGDEIHTGMAAGPMLGKAAMKNALWLQAYERRNVAIGLAAGFKGRAQIGKGMWAAPDQMKAMVAQKTGHPNAGATCAWVPSPSAATLHAMHYHHIDVLERQTSLAAEPIPPLTNLLTVPLADAGTLTAEDIDHEVANNVQGILGYVVRWIDAGVGCSKVPDITDVGLMEDRATLRIASQLIANWLHHGVCDMAMVDRHLERLAGVVDAQNEGDATYRPMAPGCDGLAFQAARALIAQGRNQPNGYTEFILHDYRQRRKAQNDSAAAA